MTRKKRVLWVGEASYLSTGFAVYGREVLSRLHAAGEFELAELATHGDTSDPADGRWEEVPWKFYPVDPDGNDPQEVARYESDPANVFGKWRFEEVLLDFRPDVVLAVRDPWMDEFVTRSPFRDCFKFGWMPTCDATPLQDDWLAAFLRADGLFAYCDWGLGLLNTQGNGRLKTVASAPPGADLDVFRPVADKRAHKAAMGLPDGSLVVGTTMRNQTRKLYPDLIAAFAKFLRHGPREAARRSYLYLHVQYPDTGWEIPALVKDAGLGARAFFTYVCDACGGSFPSFYADARRPCTRCGQHAASLPGSGKGVSREGLAACYNMMDLYVQWANCEGFGMPQVEAAACGVPVAAVDYSAMSDVVRKVGGFPLAPRAFYKECLTGRELAVPDNDALAALLGKFLSLPEPARRARGMLARRGVEEHFTYERSAGVWADWLRSLDCPPQEETWGSPPRTPPPPGDAPEGLSDLDFCRWGMTRLAGRPDLADSHLVLRMARDLTWGLTSGSIPRSCLNEMSLLGVRIRPSPTDRDAIARELLSMRRHQGHWEQRRLAAWGARP